jgi:hypothetical protein
MLKRVSGYAYAKLDDKERLIAFGEGLVGQAAQEKKPPQAILTLQ